MLIRQTTRLICVAAAAAVLAGCASTTVTRETAASADPVAREDLKPGVRVITRQEIEEVNGQHDLARALSILVPGLSVRGH
jgi:thioredoxin reductase